MSGEMGAVMKRAKTVAENKCETQQRELPAVGSSQSTVAKTLEARQRPLQLMLKAAHIRPKVRVIEQPVQG